MLSDGMQQKINIIPKGNKNKIKIKLYGGFKMKKELTIQEVARQLCDGLNMNMEEVTNGLKDYLKRNPMTLEELNNKCWNDSTEIFNEIM